MDQKNAAATPRKPRGLASKLAMGLAVLAVVLVGAWFVVTSAAFLKGVILPRVGDRLNAEVSVSDATIQPFKQVVLHNFKLQAHGEEAFFTAVEIRCRFSLWDIFRNTITVEEALIESPRIRYVEKPDGASNLGPLLEAAAVNPSRPSNTPTRSSGSLRLNIRQVVIDDAALLYMATDADGTRSSFELDEASLVLKDLRNGGQASMVLGAKIKTHRTTPATNALLLAKLAGNFNLNLDSAAKLKSIQGGMTLSVTDARGELGNLASFAAALDCQVSATEIQNLCLTAKKADQQLAQFRVSGPFDTAKGEGQLSVELSGVDRGLLNLAGAPFGLDLRGSTLESTNTLVFREHGAEIGLSGMFLAQELAVSQMGRATLPVQAQSDYDLILHTKTEVLELRAFNLDVTQQQKPLLQGQLSSPMILNWGQGRERLGDAELQLTLTNLDLRNFRTFTGTNLLSGVVEGALNVKSISAGRELNITLVASGDGVSMLSGGGLLADIGFNLRNQTRVENNDQIQISEAGFTLTHKGRNVLEAQLGGSADLTQRSVTLTAGVEAHLKELLGWIPNSKSSLQDETLKARLSLDASMSNQVVTVKKAVLSLGPTSRATNELTLTGVVDLANANAVTGQLRLAAEAMDVTRYYELFERLSLAPVTTRASSSTEPSPEETEPQAMRLPVENLVAELTMGHLFLRDLHITNWQALLRLSGGHVMLKPCSLILNGAPVTASLDLDLAVPGWNYQFVTGMDSVPLAPLVDSFLPDRNGQFSGTASAKAAIQGAGVTGPNLQKHLAGQLDLSATQLNFALDNARSRLVRTLSEILITLPDLARNPSGGTTGKLLGAVLGGTRNSDAGKWAEQMKGSPVDTLILRASAGNGSLRLEEAVAQSAAYQVRLTGEVLLAPMLTNSTLRFPVGLSLSRELAAKSGLLPANTPTNTAYAKLPDFLTLQGSLADPKAKVNYIALATLAAQSGASLTGNTGNKDLDRASGIISAVGKLLGGRSTPSSDVAVEGTVTNAPVSATNRLNDLFRP